MDYELYYTERNPYQEAELFTMLERMRRSDNLDREMDNELGELIIATTKYAITCGARRGLLFKGDDVLSLCTMFALEASRKAKTEVPTRFVSYIIAAVQNGWKNVTRNRINREKMLFPVAEPTESMELAVDIHGEPDGISQWDCLKLFTIKNKEPEDGQDKTYRGRSGGNGSGAEPGRGDPGTGKPDRGTDDGTDAE